MDTHRPEVMVCDGCWSAWGKTHPDEAVAEGSGSLDALLSHPNLADLGPDDYDLSYGYCGKCAAALVQVSHMHPAAFEGHTDGRPLYL